MFLSTLFRVTPSLLLAACLACGSYVREDEPESPASEPLAAGDSATELYFEVLRLQAKGLLSPTDTAALQRALDEVDLRTQRDEQEQEALYRATLSAFLRRKLGALRQGEYAGQVEAEQQGRGLARRRYRAGVREAERYAEHTVVLAGMLGVPTSRGELVLMVGLPVGGYIVVRLVGPALKRLPMLLRRMGSADEVLDEARRLGVRPSYAATRDEMRALAGEQAARLAENPPPHVGGPGALREGQKNVWNPSDRNDNCTACVSAVVHNSLEGYFKHTADDMERIFGYTGRERRFSVEDSLSYIEGATGLRAQRKPVSMLGDKAVVGHYAVFTRWNGASYAHVLYGRVTPTGRVILFDAQEMVQMTYEEMQKKYGPKAAPYLLEARP